MQYQQPQITGERSLESQLQFKSDKLISDADIKHGVKPVAYQAPEIGAAHELAGGLIPISRPA